MITFVTPDKFVWEEHKDNYGRFFIEPLEKGYGVTIGNTLRRVLLSSLEGIAPTAVKFEGAYHEFMTLPGVVEDLTEIILNLKQLRFSVHGETPIFIELKRKGPGEVLASDFKIPSQVEILTPNAHIATLDGEASELEIHLRLDRGKGFVLSEDIQSIFDITTIGWIPLDADFSPVKKVAYKVEDTRVGEKTDYNKLTMEIWTDGSLMPSQAVTKAADILIDHFSMIRENLGKVNVSKVTKAVNVKADVLEKSLKDMGIKERTLKVLSDAGIKTVGNLLKLSKDDLASIKGFGKKSMSDIEKLLDSLGLELSGGKK